MEEVTLLTNDHLLRSEGLDSFPKEYKVKMTWGFYCYIGALALLVLYVTFCHPLIFYNELEPALLAFDVLYFGSVGLFILFQLPMSVVRERDFIVVTFLCRKRKVPISEIEEVRIIHSLDCKSQVQGCRWKCVWGFPTRMDKTVFIFTRSFCDNYQLGLADMEGFLADNRPREDLHPQVVGMPVAEPLADCEAGGAASLDRVALEVEPGNSRS